MNYKDLDEVNCNVSGYVMVKYYVLYLTHSSLHVFLTTLDPYEHNPYSFFGVGIAENMDDTQTLMNGFMRMAIDNAALSGNLIIESRRD